MTRPDGRKNNQLRRIKVTPDYSKHAHGSCLMEFGETKVLCTAMMEEGVPPFLKNSGSGWVTAEYGMLPSSCAQRIRRNNTSGRIYEIQRLIGRSLRAVVDMKKLGEITVKIDCDVIQADGGTRTASVTGGFIALALALKKLRKDRVIKNIPLSDQVAAVSVGIYNGTNILDLNYDEDSRADMDMNVVMTGRGQFVEMQATAERRAFTRKQHDDLVELAQKGIKELVTVQKQAIGALK